jgi:hypothetical protein
MESIAAIASLNAVRTQGTPLELTRDHQNSNAYPANAGILPRPSANEQDATLPPHQSD